MYVNFVIISILFSFQDEGATNNAGMIGGRGGIFNVVQMRPQSCAVQLVFQYHQKKLCRPACHLYLKLLGSESHLG